MPPAFVSSIPWRLDAHPKHGRVSTPICKHSLSHALQNFVADIRSKLRRRAKRDPPKRISRDYDSRKPSDEWLDLVAEFEQRANSRQDAQSDPLEASTGPKKGGRPTSGYLEYLPHVQTAFMAAITVQLWYAGRILRLDSFLLLLYPLPCMYISARWGLSYGDRCLCVILFIMFVTMGPMYTQFYIFNTGLLTFTYTRTLWWKWPWWACLLAGGLAKAIGLTVNMAWASFVFETNVWKFLAFQIRTMLEGMFAVISKLPFVPKLPTPTLMQVKVGIAAVIALHSLYHVFCTLFLSALLLVRVSEDAKLARVPSGVPFVSRLLRKMRDDPQRLNADYHDDL